MSRDHLKALSIKILYLLSHHYQRVLWPFLKYLLTLFLRCISFSLFNHEITLLIFICQGQKGETGPAGKSPQGAVKFHDTAEKCTLRTAGTVRYNVSQKALQLCDGSAWLPLVTERKGHVVSRPGRHCMDILKSGGIDSKRFGK